LCRCHGGNLGKRDQAHKHRSIPIIIFPTGADRIARAPARFPLPYGADHLLSARIFAMTHAGALLTAPFFRDESDVET
jgi:hypothetical protein